MQDKPNKIYLPCTTYKTKSHDDPEVETVQIPVCDVCVGLTDRGRPSKHQIIPGTSQH